MVCNPAALRRDCSASAALVSFGVNEDVTFEVAVANRSGCTVHAFDFSVPGLPIAAAGGADAFETECGGRIEFAPWGLGVSDSPSHGADVAADICYCMVGSG